MAQFQWTQHRYGAPMGRASYQEQGPMPRRSVQLFRVRLDNGGYDDGGHYWGHGAPIYCARDKGDTMLLTVRASSRAEACKALALCPGSLAKPLDRTND
jgi:hypothetical protein